MKVGFIGLGAMGQPMVLHLLRAGHAVHVWARRATTTVVSREAGATVHDTPASLARQCDVVCTNVYSDADVEALAFGSQGLAEGFAAGGVHVDFSTISPTMARRLAARWNERGVVFVDAPVSGGSAGAQAATLAIMWGGREPLAQRLAPLFGVLGKSAVRVGEAGAGQVAKACNQMIMVAAIEACAEAAHLANAAGIDFAKVREAMLGGSAGSRVLDVFGGRMAAREFQAGVVSHLHHKDFGLLHGEARRLGAPLPVASAVGQQLNVAMALGMGNHDSACLLRVLECACGGSATVFHSEKETA